MSLNEALEPGTDGISEPHFPQGVEVELESPRRLDFPTRPQAAMNAVGQLGDPETAMRAFEVLRRSVS